MSDNRTMRDRVSLFGRIIKFTVIVGIIVVAVGFVFGWFSLSMRDSDTENQDRFDIVFTVNKDAFWNSAEEAKEEAVGLKDAVSEAAELETIEGEITDINHDAKRVTIALEGKSSESATVQLNAESEVLVEDEAAELDDLAVGTKVSITYVEKDEVKRVKKISQL